MIGKQVLNYRIESMIAEGGMGNVYLAVHAQIGKKAAIKVLNPLLAKNPDLRARFKEEALTMSKFDHTNIVNIIDYVETDENTYLIMEYAEGLTLDRYIAETSGPLNDELCINLFTQMLEALGFIHDHQIIHRDIKPSNFIISSRNRVKLIDFGIAKRLEGRDKKLTRTGINMGTPFYMSPEQVKGENVDSRSDIYSMGVTLYQMVTGQCPYQDTTSEYSIYDQIVNQPLPEARTVNPLISEKMENAIHKATAKNLSDRFQTCDEFIEALRGKVEMQPRPKAETPSFDKTVINQIPKEPVNAAKTIVTEIKPKPFIQKGADEVVNTTEETPEKQVTSELSQKQTAKKNRMLIPVILIAVFVISVSVSIYLALGGGGKNIKKELEKGDVFMKIASYDSALVYYNKALKLDEKDPDIIKKVSLTQDMIEGLAKFYSAKYKESFDIFKKASAFGSPDADYYLGELTFNGMGTAKDKVKGLEFTQKAVDHGFGMGYWRLGWVYEKGAGVKMDTVKANECYKKAYDFIVKLADNGDPEAMGNLAGYYSKGTVVKKSTLTSFKWRKKSAEKGYAFEQVNLGHLYYYPNDSIKQDYKEAMKWYRKAADNGDPSGQIAVGNMYFYGDGVTKNCNTALTWYQKSTDSGYPEGINAVGTIYLNGSCGAKDPQKAIGSFLKVLDIDRENLNAMNNLASCYYNGTGVDKNYKEAAGYYEQMIGADSSLSYPYYCLSILYDEGGYGIQKDLVKSLGFCTKASEMGYVNAQNSLGMKYYKGEGCPKDETKAKYWFKKAADQGHQTAKENLDYISKPKQKEKKFNFDCTPQERRKSKAVEQRTNSY